MSEGQFKIVMGRSPQDVSIELDGRVITKMVRGLTVKAEVGHLTTVELALLPSRVEIEGDAEVLSRLYDPHTKTLSRARRLKVRAPRPLHAAAGATS